MHIELRDISKHFGSVRANDGISLCIDGGVILGLLGENGAGKTTLMKILSGYQSYDDGGIFVDGRPLRLRSPADAIAVGIGMLHQDPLDVPAHSVLENFLLGRAGGLALPRRSARQELERLCERFGFSLDPNATVGTLTVGERQQLEIVRLLSLGVRVIIFDEPTTGISAPQRESLFQALRQLATAGLAVVFVSHKLEEVVSLCSRVVVLRKGKVAGAATAPLDAEELVTLMFGQALPVYQRAQAALGEVVLELDHVSLRDQRMLLSPITLAVRAGESIGLAGLEGSGQRLLMRACAGLERLDSGRIRIGATDLTNLGYPAFMAAGVAYVPAARLEEGLVGRLSFREHVALVANDGGFFVRRAAAEARASELIARLSIVGTASTPVEALSGGNQQRALLALLPERLRLLVVEHPTRGLDLGSSAWVWHSLYERRRAGTAVVFTSADLDEIIAQSDRVIVFSGGRASTPRLAATLTADELGNLIAGRGL